MIRYWTVGEFPALTREWFVEHCVGNPQQAFDEWGRFLESRQRSSDARFRKALELTTELTSGAVYHYLFRRHNPTPGSKERRLAPRTVMTLDAVSKALGSAPSASTVLSMAAPNRGTRKLVLFADLAAVPSPRYHLAVLESIVRAGDRLNFSVALHQVRQSDAELSAHTARILRNNLPHGVVWFRLTPDLACLSVMSTFANALPVVLVHASRLRYPLPVIANVVPNHEAISTGVEMWARNLPEYSTKIGLSVVVAAMAPEEAPEKANAGFESLGKLPVSIRQERIERIVAGIRASKLHAVVHFVDDYSASQSYALVQKYPKATGYVCLSDEIAVGVKQLLLAGRRDPRRRILGFDGSALAMRHRIPSFDQRLSDLGDRVIEQFSTWFGKRTDSDRWTECREVGVELMLSPRE